MDIGFLLKKKKIYFSFEIHKGESSCPPLPFISVKRVQSLSSLHTRVSLQCISVYAQNPDSAKINK